MPENENKIIPINIDDYQYYIRRDQDMNRIEKLVLKAKESSHEMIDVKEILIIFE